MQLGFPLQTMAVFAIFVAIAFCIDFFAHSKDKEISLGNAVIWSIFWILVSVAFGVYIWQTHGSEMGSLFFSGYVLEKALSIDNLFVMMAIFTWFKIPNIYRHRILYFGILGAIVFRLIFVALGTSLLLISPLVEGIFALIIIYTAFMMLKNSDDEGEIDDYSNHLAYRLVYRFFPVFPKIIGHNLFISPKTATEQIQKDKSINFSLKNAKIIATPLFLCLCVIELSDVMFAFDSVPAVIAISHEPLIVYSAMIFAILGLRTLYFVLEALKKYLVHLEKAVIVLLFFIGVKLLLNVSNHIFSHSFQISAMASLCVIVGILSCGVLASFLFPKD